MLIELLYRLSRFASSYCAYCPHRQRRPLHGWPPDAMIEVCMACQLHRIKIGELAPGDVQWEGW